MAASDDLSGRSYLVRNLATGWVSQLATIITGFFLPRVVNDLLGQQIVGLWDLAWSFVAYVALANLGIGSAFNRFVSKYRAEDRPDQLQAAVSTVALIQACIASVTALVVVGAVYTLPVWYSELGELTALAQEILLFLGLSIAVQFLFDGSRGVLTGCHRWDLHNAVTTGFNVVCSLSMILALLLGGGLETVSVIYFVFACMESITRAIVARRICPEAKINLRSISSKYAEDILKYGLASFMIGLIPIIITQTTSIIVGTSFGPAALAVLARPNALMRLFRAFVTKFTYVLTPMASAIIASEGPDKLREFLISSTTFAIAITLPPSVLFCLYGNDIIALWMGEEYVNSALMLILTVGMTIRLSLNASVRILMGLNYHRRISVIGLIVSIGGYAAGAAVLQQTGHASMEAYAALMSGTMAIVYGIWIPAYTCRRLEIGFMTYIWQSASKVIQLLMLPTAILLIADSQFDGGLAGAIVKASLYCIVVAILYWVVLLPVETKRKLGKRIR